MFAFAMTTHLKSTDNKIKVAIFGASGYGGSELLRILLFHAGVEICVVTANEHAGKAVSAVHRNLYGLTDLIFAKAEDVENELEKIDCIFLALPHGAAMDTISRLPKSVKTIDLSGDFRLTDADEYARHYHRAHTAREMQKEFVYGLTETNREAIKGAMRLANPGCFATATLLALAPLVKENLVAGRVIVDAKTGSSGSGAKAAANTHHPSRATSFYAYKPFAHQHVPEIEQELRRINDAGWSKDFVFMTHSLPVARGIFVSVYLETKRESSLGELYKVFTSFYRDSFFVRVVEGSPDINHVKTTNFCDIGIAARGTSIVVFAAIDNLVKGAAGQAVQNMNLMFGFEEKTGLMLAGTNP